MNCIKTILTSTFILVLGACLASMPVAGTALADVVDNGETSYEKGLTDTQVDNGNRNTGDKGMSKEEYEALLKRLLERYKRCVKNATTQEENRACELPPQGYGDAVCDENGCSFADPEVIARQVIARITMPASTPVFGPDPDINKITPGKLVVGFPYWLTVPGEGFLTTSETSQGLRLRLDSRRVKVVYQMGDGTTLECAKTQPWPGPRLGVNGQGVPKESPVCGHRFATKGTYTVTATVHWEVTWNGAGQSGVVPLQFTDSKTFEVVPLQTRVER